MKFKRQMLDFEECLIERLQDPEHAKIYLMVSLEEYDKDQNIEPLVDSLKLIAAAKQGVLKLPNQTIIHTSKLDQLITNTGNLNWTQVLDALDIEFLPGSTSAQPAF